MTELEPNKMESFLYKRSDITNACKIIGYKFVHCQNTNNHADNREASFSWECNLHGKDCMGHLETDSERKYTLMPSSLIPNTDSITNRYQRDKNNICSGSISIEEYKNRAKKIMMGKRGLIHFINSRGWCKKTPT